MKPLNFWVVQESTKEAKYHRDQLKLDEVRSQKLVVCNRKDKCSVSDIIKWLEAK